MRLNIFVKFKLSKIENSVLIDLTLEIQLDFFKEKYSIFSIILVWQLN